MEIHKYRYIDALRGWAVLGVLFVHLFQSSSPYLWIITDFGARGVQLFYILSACTLFLSMDKRLIGERNPYINFFIRRFFRIAPLFYVCILYYIFIQNTSVTLGELFSVITFTNGWSPYWIEGLVHGQWSIAVEMMFYLLVPFLFAKIKKINTSMIVCGVIFVFSGFITLFLQTYPMIGNQDIWMKFVFFNIISQLPIFSLGILLFFLLKEGKEFKFSKLLIIGAYIGLGLLSLFAISSHFLGFSAFQRGLPYYIMVCGVGGLLMIGTYYLSLNPHRFFINKTMEYIGKISYSMYLTHFIVLYYEDGYFGPLMMTNFHSTKDLILACVGHLIILLVGSVLLSTITYYCIEKPGQIIGKKIIYRFSQ